MIINRKNSLSIYRGIFHLLVLVFFIFIPSMDNGPEVIGNFTQRPFPSNPVQFTLILLVPFYLFNVYFLIPRFLKKGNYAKYAFLIALGSLLMVLLISTTSQGVQPPDFPLRPNMGRFRIGMIFFPMMLLLTVGTSFEMIINWEALRREKSQIEQEKLFSELSFLRSQINPHFLFNTLNNIYSLAETKSDRTGEAILLLSSLMRYVLYGANKGKIAISKEIECIKDYIAIQSLRISKEESVNIELKTDCENPETLIEPLILLPFIENAFKHSLSYNQKSEIRITISLKNQLLHLIVFNTKKSSEPFKEKDKDSGIGLDNIKKRLNLLYHHMHELEIVDEKFKFEIDLKILL